MTFAGLCVVTFGLAVFALTRRRLLWGVIGVGAHSLALAGVYLFLAAPDVALTEAAVGFALVTFIYLLALRRTGRLVVAATEAAPLLYTENEEIVGLEWEILQRFGRWLHLDVEVLWVPRSEMPRLLLSGEAELAAGGFVPGEGDRELSVTKPVVPTRMVRLQAPGRAGPTVAVRGDRGADLLPEGGQMVDGVDDVADAVEEGSAGGAVVDALRLWMWHLRGWGEGLEVSSVEEDLGFCMAVAPENEELGESLDAFLAELVASGELEELVRRYLG
ncbi:MAG: hydrogenase subunit MbhD domain-containing protein [Candidatus Bipolaricaulota bacterium]